MCNTKAQQKSHRKSQRYIEKMKQSMTYQVLWKKLWLSQLKIMAILFTISFPFAAAIRYVKSDFVFSAAFPPLMLSYALVIIPGVALLLVILTWLLAMLTRMANITIYNGSIYGRNYWGFKNSFLLSESVSSYKVSKNGIDAIVLVSKNSGKIYISTYTERLSELLGIIESYILKNNT